MGLNEQRKQTENVSDPGLARGEAEEREAGAVEGPEVRRRHIAEE
jgi:hypothetical protein